MAEDTGLFAELASDQNGTGNTCNTFTVLSNLPDDERASWEAAMRNSAFTAASIFRASERHGLGLAEQSVQRHIRRLRKGQGCLCPR